ncbi:MAG: hypothetical protein QM778_35950 [Myxococcales bacterium]
MASEVPVPESIVACGTKVPLKLGTPLLSSTLVGDDLVRGSCVRGTAPECVFILDVPTRSDVRVSLESADFDGALVLADPERTTEFLCVDDSPTGDTHHTRFETTLGAGQYAVMVEGANGEAGQFALFAEVDPLPAPAQACAQAGLLTPAASVRGSTRGAPNQFGASCGGGAEGPDRVHSFELAEPARVRIWQQSEYESTLYLRSRCEDPSTEIVCRTYPGGAGPSILTAELAAGRYYLFTDSFGRSQSGDYVLSMEQAALPKEPSVLASCAAAQGLVLTPGEIEIDTLHAPSVLEGSCGGSKAPERLFHLSLKEETTIQVELLDAEFDAVIYLRVECGDERSEISCVRAPRADLSAEAEVTPQPFTATIGPGEYTLGVDGQFENQMGAVRVRLSSLPMSLARTQR